MSGPKGSLQIYVTVLCLVTFLCGCVENSSISPGQPGTPPKSAKLARNLLQQQPDQLWTSGADGPPSSNRKKHWVSEAVAETKGDGPASPPPLQVAPERPARCAGDPPEDALDAWAPLCIAACALRHPPESAAAVRQVSSPASALRHPGATSGPEDKDPRRGHKNTTTTRYPSFTDEISSRRPDDPPRKQQSHQQTAAAADQEHQGPKPHRLLWQLSLKCDCSSSSHPVLLPLDPSRSSGGRPHSAPPASNAIVSLRDRWQWLRGRVLQGYPSLPPLPDLPLPPQLPPPQQLQALANSLSRGGLDVRIDMGTGGTYNVRLPAAPTSGGAATGPSTSAPSLKLSDVVPSRGGEG